METGKISKAIQQFETVSSDSLSEAVGTSLRPRRGLLELNAVPVSLGERCFVIETLPNSILLSLVTGH